jgi:hypothetical protein
MGQLPADGLRLWIWARCPMLRKAPKMDRQAVAEQPRWRRARDRTVAEHAAHTGGREEIEHLEAAPVNLKR